MNVFKFCAKDVTTEVTASMGKIVKVFELVRVIFRNIKGQIRHDILAFLLNHSATAV